MAEFILESGGLVETAAGRSLEFADLDEFTRGYIEALFFTENEPGVLSDEIFTAAGKFRKAWRDRVESGQIREIPADFGFADLAPESLQAIISDCARFQELNESTLQAAYDCPGPGDSGFDELRTNPDYSPIQAGRDFLFTRNGHGVGFWDRGLGQVGEDLSAACGWGTPFPEICALLGEDRRVHVS